MNSTLVFSAGLYSADTEVFKTSSGALKKVTTSYDQTRRQKVRSENQNLGDSADEILHRLKLKNLNRLAIGHLNINSYRKKFDSLKPLVKNSLNVFMKSKTKLDETFPESQFLMDGFTPPYRMYRNTNGGGIELYVREDIPSRQISFKSDDKDIELFLWKSASVRKND